jgi:maleylpyruvate isomerase
MNAPGGVRQDPAVTLPWMRAGQAEVERVVAELSDDALRAPSALPGWSAAHVVGHLARNAEALSRLVAWARTGIETPMYAHREQRAADIETSAKRPAEVLRTELTTTAEALDAALAGLDETTWQAGVRSALGRPIPAAEIPWMRVREVWLHGVDLGESVDALPDGVVDALLDDVTGVLSGRDGCPAALLEPTDRDRTWRLGPEEPTAPVVRGSAAELVAWITGRARRADAPALPDWL